jgi:cell division protein FtsZ
MDELGEITDFMYDAASDDALIIRGLSKDENLNEEICVTVIATGFESNSIFQPYKAKKQEKVELVVNKNSNSNRNIHGNGNDVFSVHDKGKKSIITDFEDEYQGVIDFNPGYSEDMNEIRNKKSDINDDSGEKPEATLRRVKHMQNILKKEGLSNKTMKENIDTFEDVPAYVRKNLSVGAKEKGAESKGSKFTLTSGDNDEPVLRENNAYLHDNVD